MSAADSIPPSNIIAQLRSGSVSGLRARLLSEPPILPLVTTRGDFDLDPTARPAMKRELRPAAVLLPIVQRDEPTVLLTQRTHTLAQHAGQVAFPGGRVEPTDVSLVQTALRETLEETGIAATFITVAGFLDAYETGTGFAILPVVGLLAGGFALAPNPGEVAEIFEVPLAFLLDAANRKVESRQFEGRTRSFYSFSYDGHYIWGATAAMLVNFGERLRSA